MCTSRTNLKKPHPGIRKLTAVLVVAGNRAGPINHMVMTVQSCRSRGAHLRGAVLNMIHDGYGELMMRRDLDALGAAVLGAVPRLDRPADLGGYLDVGSVLGGWRRS